MSCGSIESGYNVAQDEIFGSNATTSTVLTSQIAPLYSSCRAEHSALFYFSENSKTQKPPKGEVFHRLGRKFTYKFRVATSSVLAPLDRTVFEERN